MKMHVNFFIILLFVFSTGIIKAQMTDEVTKDLDEHRLSLLQNLNKCYEVAEDILGSNEQDSSEKYMLEGKRYSKVDAIKIFKNKQHKEYGIENLILKGKGLYLHAYSLKFIHPFTNEKVNLKDDLPEKFKKIFINIK
jgi:hypothetical protein